MKKRKKGYGLLIIKAVIFTLAMISTVIPNPSASKICMLGYKAHCSFTPISTILCAFFAGLTCFYRKRKLTE